MIQELAANLYRIQIPLEGSPLKNLNCYFFRCGDRDLLVDTGFNQPSCLAELRRGLAELNAKPERTDIYITHSHSDHSGLLSQTASPNSRVYMTGVDASQYLHGVYDPENFWSAWIETYRRQGFPPAELEGVMAENPAKAYADGQGVTITPLGDGQHFQVGDRSFTCILTPGHTPGHGCLYEPATETLALGDHVLFDITPNITAWGALPNALGHYLRSLEKIRSLPVKRALPGHREQGALSLAQRIDQLIDHHQERLAEVLSIVGKQSGLTGYEIASRMTWSIRAKSWEDFPLAQKWFATGEAQAHLEFLMAGGKLRREGEALYRYHLAE